MEFHTSVQVLTFIVGTLMPLLVGVVTKKVANRGLKLATNAFLSAVAGVLSAAIGAGGVLHLEAFITPVEAFIVSMALYHGVWKPIGVSGAVQDATADFGIGGPMIDTLNWPNEKGLVRGRGPVPTTPPPAHSMTTVEDLQKASSTGAVVTPRCSANMPMSKRP